jgi:hypothetical protein
LLRLGTGTRERHHGRGGKRRLHGAATRGAERHQELLPGATKQAMGVDAGYFQALASGAASTAWPMAANGSTKQVKCEQSAALPHWLTGVLPVPFLILFS